MPKKPPLWRQSFQSAGAVKSWLRNIPFCLRTQTLPGPCGLDTLARALGLGPLRNADIELPPALKEKIRNALPESIPADNAYMVYELIAYYVVNKPEYSDWVVLPVTNFDYCFGDSNFSHTYLSRIPEEILVRSHKYDISRYRVMPEYLP